MNRCRFRFRNLNEKEMGEWDGKHKHRNHRAIVELRIVMADCRPMTSVGCIVFASQTGSRPYIGSKRHWIPFILCRLRADRMTIAFFFSHLIDQTSKCLGVKRRRPIVIVHWRRPCSRREKRRKGKKRNRHEPWQQSTDFLLKFQLDTV